MRAYELSRPGQLREALHYKLREVLDGDGATAYRLAGLCQARDEPAKTHDWVTDAILGGA